MTIALGQKQLQLKLGVYGDTITESMAVARRVTIICWVNVVASADFIGNS